MVQASDKYILGIDLGTASIGWAVVGLTAGKPSGLIAAGSRIFPAGTEGDIGGGKDESRAANRREARLHRRQLWRRRRRKAKILNILQQARLLPEGDRSPEFLSTLDQNIAKKIAGDTKGNSALGHTWPYHLRAIALDQKLELHELGRAIYHLAQRRGFLSNRKTVGKKDEDLGAVKSGIESLYSEMQKTGSRTLGEFFATLDPEKHRIRARWTARSMFEQEFNQIWQAQAKYYPEILTDNLYNSLKRALFFQRPLKSQRHLVGECELEPGAKRARIALLSSQRFRMLQMLNNLEVRDSTSDEDSFTLNANQIVDLRNALETDGDLTWSRVRKIVGIKRSFKFNYEEGGEKRMLGNRTASHLRAIFGDSWDRMQESEKDKVVQDLVSIEKEEVLKKRGKEVWGLSDEKADEFSQIHLEEGRLNLSTRAIKKILPRLEEGLSYEEARKDEYPFADKAGDVLDSLPPLVRAPLQSLKTIKNPVVSRTLSELRKVVNAIIRQYGKPELVHVELARELKQSRQKRKELSQKNNANRKGREKAAIRILAEIEGVDKPTPEQIKTILRSGDVEKLLLADECKWMCPFTGKQISMKALVGQNQQFDIEHIIPFSRSFDNSWLNKTLCFHEENRNVKKNRTPFEAYGSDPEKFEQILQRVENFGGSDRDRQIKLAKFSMTPEQIEDNFGGFEKRQLNDTSYASRLAADYLGLLYGGRIDQYDKRRVRVSPGRITAYCRDAWQLNGILSDNNIKTRGDHRHHAIDALVVALVSPTIVKQLSKQSQLEHQRGRLSVELNLPWPAFQEDARSVMQSINVSHRPNRVLRGGLHEETLYSRPYQRKDPKKEKLVQVHHVRKPVAALSKGEIENIVDPAVRDAVMSKLQELGGDPKKFEAGDGENYPVLAGRNGRVTPIKKVRYMKKQVAYPIGDDDRQRHVLSGSNHHLAVYEIKDKKGNPKWIGEVVSIYEASNRLRKGEPVIKRTHQEDPGADFVFSLQGGDLIELELENKRQICVVRGTALRSSGIITVTYCSTEDARMKKEIISAGKWQEKSPEILRKSGCRKIHVDSLGHVYPQKPDVSIRA